jgi:hypothetical protein
MNSAAQVCTCSCCTVPQMYVLLPQYNAGGQGSCTVLGVIRTPCMQLLQCLSRSTSCHEAVEQPLQHHAGFTAAAWFDLALIKQTQLHEVVHHIGLGSGGCCTIVTATSRTELYCLDL